MMGTLIAIPPEAQDSYREIAACLERLERCGGASLREAGESVRRQYLVALASRPQEKGAWRPFVLRLFEFLTLANAFEIYFPRDEEARVVLETILEENGDLCERGVP